MLTIERMQITKLFFEQLFAIKFEGRNENEENKIEDKIPECGNFFCSSDIEYEPPEKYLKSIKEETNKQKDN